MTNMQKLIAKLNSSNPYLRYDAIVKLGDIGDPRAVEPLIQELRCLYGDVRRAAILALTKIGEPAVEPLINSLISTLDYSYGETVEFHAAISALTKIGEPAVEPLIRLLESEYSHLQPDAAEALGAIGDPRAIKPLIKQLKDEDAKAMRIHAAYALGEIGDKRAVFDLVEVLKCKEASEDFRPYRWSSDREDRYSLRYAAAKALGVIGNAHAIEPLIMVYEDEDENMVLRCAAAEALGAIGNSQAVEPLIKGLYDRHTGSRPPGDEVALLLHHSHQTEAAMQLSKDLDDKWDNQIIRKATDIALAASSALAEIGDPRAVEPLIQKLKVEDEEMRKRAAYALGKIGDKRAVKQLHVALKDQSVLVRQTASWALGAINSPR